MRILFKNVPEDVLSKSAITVIEIEQAAYDGNALHLLNREGKVIFGTEISREGAEKAIDKLYKTGCLDINSIVEGEYREERSAIEPEEPKNKYANISTDTLFANLPLNARAYNCLARYLKDNCIGTPAKCTAKDVFINVPFLKPVRNLGKAAAEEITELFKAIGLPVQEWEAEVRQWSIAKKTYTPAEIKKAVDERYTMALADYVMTNIAPMIEETEGK